MKEWITSVTVSVFLVAVIGLILPDGKMTKSVKHVFTLILIPIILQPLFNLKLNGFDFTNAFNDSDILLQNEYIEYINDKKVYEYCSNCVNIISDLGVQNVVVDLIYYTDENLEIIVEKVIIDLRNSVINSDKAHIDIIDDIITATSEYMAVEQNKVVIYE